MKHLKLFREGVNDAKKSDYDLVFIFDLPDKEDFYKHINKEEWMDIRNYKHKLVDFPGSQMDILNRTHTTHESYCKWKLARGHYTCYRNDSYTNPTTGRRYTRYSWIFLLDDEWYVIQDVVQYGGVVVEEEWYKCDQFDGLIELLKDKKIVDDEKHLKLYKESFDTYQNKNLTEDGWYDELGDGMELIRRDGFTKQEIDEIKKEISKINSHIDYTLNPRDTRKDCKDGTLDLSLNFEWCKEAGMWRPWVKNYTGNKGFNLEIMKAQDEWFYIEVETYRTYRNVKDLETSFYKCDGLDGLIQQLKYFKFIYDLS